MKNLIIALLMLLSFGANAQDQDYIITGYQFDHQDQSSKVENNGSSIQILGGEYSGILLIRNNGLDNLLTGKFINNNIPNTIVQKSATKYESIMKQCKLQYYLKYFDTGATTDVVYADISMIYVNHPDKTLINCIILTSNGHTIEYLGYRNK